MENNPNNGKKSVAITLLIYFLIGAALVSMLYFTLKVDTDVTEDDYYQIISYFDEGKVEEYTLNISSRELKFLLKGEKEKRTYRVPNAQLFIQDVHDIVREYNKEHKDAPIKMNYEAGASSSWLVNVLPMVLVTVGLGILLWWLMNKMSNTMMSETNRTIAFGKARLKSGDDESHRTTFDDVAGVDEEKEDLMEIVEFLRAPDKFSDLGARIPKGVLLVGPPGTGKTLLARAVAGEANATFLSISGSDFVEMYVGVGASRVRDLFETAKKNTPAIIFIDEIDAVGRHRGAGMGGGHDEREQTLNQLLVEMDGFATNVGIIIIAATNRPDILDPALLRPGRFDRRITVNYPDVRGREAILRVHARNKPIGPDVSLGDIARATGGFTGADLENLLNEAALLAARRSKKALTRLEIEEATIKVVVGTEKKSKKVTDKERKLTAYHEAGHAITNYYLGSLDPVHQISIIPRGMAGGYTMSLPKEDKSYSSKSQMLDELVTLLGGRVAESIVLGDISTGASNDIERATGIARSMITKYGMSEKLGPITYGSDNDEVFLGKNYNHMRNYSEDTAAAIDKEISNIISEAYDRADEILRIHIDKLHTLAKFLMNYEKIDGELFTKLMSDDNFSMDQLMNSDKQNEHEEPHLHGPEDANSPVKESEQSDDKEQPGESDRPKASEQPEVQELPDETEQPEDQDQLEDQEQPEASAQSDETTQSAEPALPPEESEDTEQSVEDEDKEFELVLSQDAIDSILNMPEIRTEIPQEQDRVQDDKDVFTSPEDEYIHLEGTPDAIDEVSPIDVYINPDEDDSDNTTF